MLTIKDILAELAYYTKYIFRFKYIILLCILLGASYSFIKQQRKSPSYEAIKTFMVADDDGGASIGSVLGQFGFGGGGGAQSNYQKIRKIGLSNKILSQVLFDSASLDGKNDLVIHHFISVFALRDQWDNDSYKKYYFSSRDNLDLTGKSILKGIVNRLKGDLTLAASGGVLSITPDVESTILEISAKTMNPEFSILLAESLYEKLASFYIEKSIESNLKTFNVLKQKSDSLAGLLAGSESSLARSSDYTLGLVLNKDKTDFSRNTRNIQMYAAMYEEVTRNKETAAFMLNSKTPYFQEIDSPYLPIYNQNAFSLVPCILFGIGLGIFVIIILLVLGYYKKEIRPLFKDINESTYTS